MKKLMRSRKQKVIAGVCGGLAEYFQTDPVIVRIILVLLFFFSHGAALIAYIIAWIIIPERPVGEEAAAEENGNLPASAESGGECTTPAPSAKGTGALIFGSILIILGVLFLMDNFFFFRNYLHWFRHYAWRFFWPSLLVVIGFFLIVRGSRKE